MLTSSSVPEAVAATYSGATAYVVGDRVGLAPVDGAAQLVYECIQNGTGQALPVPPATTTAYWKKVLRGVPCLFRCGYLRPRCDRVEHWYECPRIVRIAECGKRRQRAYGSYEWLLLGATNRWKMFDAVANSQTFSEDTITVVLAPGTLVNSAVLRI